MKRDRFLFAATAASLAGCAGGTSNLLGMPGSPSAHATGRHRHASSSNPYTQPQVEGFPDQWSATPGSKINFMLRCSAAAYSKVSISFYKMVDNIASLGAPLATINGSAVVNAPGYDADQQSAINGCTGWTPNAFTIPASWPSDLYFARIVVSGNSSVSRCIPFVVRPAARTHAIAVVVPENTYQAYNAWGNAAFYPYTGQPGDANECDGICFPTISFNRPIWGGAQTFSDAETGFRAFLKTAGIQVDYYTSSDVQTTPSLLLGYKCVTSCWHDEYWSSALFDAYDSAVTNKVNLAIFGANTAYWKVRWNATTKQLTCYKQQPNGTAFCYGPDPLANQDTWTGFWWFAGLKGAPQPYAPGRFLGGGPMGGYLLTNAQEANRGYTVNGGQSGHWAYAGTNFTDGEVFGYIPGGTSMMGYETDAVYFSLSGGTAVPTFVDGAGAAFGCGPGNTTANEQLKILAYCQLPTISHIGEGTSSPLPGQATMSILEPTNAGSIFMSGCTDWAVTALSPLTPSNYLNVKTITKNVLTRFSA